MTVKEIYDIMNDIAPFDSACEWDNCGLICGDMNDKVLGIYLTLDADLYALEKAKECGANLVISHHPLMFDAVRKVTADMPVYQFIRNGVSVISSHTCLDAANGGINDVLADIVGLCDAQPLMLDGVALGRVGTVAVDNNEEYIAYLCDALNTGAQYSLSQPIKYVAIVSGGGASGMNEAIRIGCDTLITGEAKHDNFVKAQELSFNLITLGHFETENIILKPLYEQLKDLCPVTISDRKCNIRRM